MSKIQSPDKPVFKIEKGIPIGMTRIGRPLYPFKEMKVGDSFLVERPEDVILVRSAAYTSAARLGMKFSCRKAGDGMRVWRIK